MYADDLALICESPSDLQSMLASYASLWRYCINVQKSGIMLLGESSSSRHHNHPLRSWLIGGSPITEMDEQHYMGVLQTVRFTTMHHTVERCSAGRSSFIALNVVGSRFGCLHPLTSLRLYSSFCIPIRM